jgi:hypothetical protein
VTGAGGPSRAAGSGGETERRMRAITAGLTAAGLVSCLNVTRGVLDITATLERPGGKPSQVIIDEDGYIEVRYWNRPDATPGADHRGHRPRAGRDRRRAADLTYPPTPSPSADRA